MRSGAAIAVPTTFATGDRTAASTVHERGNLDNTETPPIDLGLVATYIDQLPPTHERTLPVIRPGNSWRPWVRLV